jgi:tetratricopeptide (TPR) repeat protein
MTAEPDDQTAPAALKIAVYAICLNEEAFVPRFMDSCREADMVVVADTGSSDGAVAALEARGAVVHRVDIRPWRFDRARQAALDLVPDDVDICVSLDLDQVLEPGWRRILERAWKPPANRVFYTLAWARNHDGSPRQVLDNRIHARHGFVWRYPAHECVLADGIDEHILVIRHLRIDHRPDPDKSRGQYLGLLELAAREEPDLARHAHYLGREYLFLGRHADALAQFERQFAMPAQPGDLERNVSLRLAAQCREALGQGEAALALWRRAVAERPDARGPLVDLAWALYRREAWAECYERAARAAAMPDLPAAYGAASDSGVLPEDMACLCAARLGLAEAALAYGRRALALAPDAERIRRNVERMEAALKTPAEPEAGPEPASDPFAPPASPHGVVRLS